MTATQTTTSTHDATATVPGVATEIAEALAPFVGGALPVHLTAWDGSTAGPQDAPRVVLRSPRALRRLLRHPGELGASQAYVTGELDVEGDLNDALTHVWDVAHERGLGGIRPTPATIAAIVKVAKGAGALGVPLPPPASQAVLKGRLHSLGRDKQAIHHHYDLSNEFYELILDPHMAYSCGYWTSDDPDYTVEDAQRDKLDLVCRKLGLEPGMRLLDIGCGWGSMSLYAAEHFGAQVTGVTIAAEQKRFIDARIAERGLQDRVEIRLQDYRDVPRQRLRRRGRRSRWASTSASATTAPTPRCCTTASRPGGRVLIQQMSRRGRHPGGGPFIESFIAPDMTMRPVGQTVDLIEERGSGGARRARSARALRPHRRRLARHVRGQLGPRRRPGRRGGRPRLAALPRRGIDGLPGRPDGRRPDPLGPTGPRDVRSAARSARRPGHDLRRVELPGRHRGFSLLAVVVLMAATAVVGAKQGRVSVVDTTWGLGFVVVRVVAALVGDGTGWRRLAARGRRRPVGPATGVARHPPQRRQGRGPSLRGDAGEGERQPDLGRDPQGLPRAGPRRVVRLAAASRSARASDRHHGRWPSVGRAPVGGRPRVRGGRRRAAQGVQGRLRQQGQGHGPRPVVVDAAPQLLRRLLRLVGNLRRARRAPGRVSSPSCRRS